MPQLLEVVDGRLRLHFHPGQQKLWDSTARVVAVVAGFQSGKTCSTPIWLWREIMRCGPGDYGFICPNFTLMETKALPEFKNFFKHLLRLGEYTGSPVRKFAISKEGERRLFGRNPDVGTNVFFGYAENPDSLESATWKAAVCDEAGQKAFKRDSWDAINRRLAVNQGRILITTTPYANAGWLKSEIYDRWVAGDKSIDFIRFESTMNPAFPVAEYERLRASLPLWKFRMFVQGHFERPAGLIYDCFDETRHKIQRFPIPDRWRRLVGLDFGGINTAATFFAEDPTTKRWYAYREYKAGNRTAKEHAKEIREGEPLALTCYGGSKSEGQWRDEFRAAGLSIREPDQADVEVGINRVYGAIKRGEIYVFDDLPGLIEELTTYSRNVDDKGEPTMEIEAKASFHRIDSARYIISPLKKETPKFEITLPGRGEGMAAMEAPEGVF